MKGVRQQRLSCSKKARVSSDRLVRLHLGTCEAINESCDLWKMISKFELQESSLLGHQTITLHHNNKTIWRKLDNMKCKLYTFSRSNNVWIAGSRPKRRTRKNCFMEAGQILSILSCGSNKGQQLGSRSYLKTNWQKVVGCKIGYALLLGINDCQSVE